MLFGYSACCWCWGIVQLIWSVEVLCCWDILPAAGVGVEYSWFLQHSSLAWRWDDGRWRWGEGRWGRFCFWKFNQHQSRKKRRKKDRQTELCDVCWYSVSINYFLFGDTLPSVVGVWPYSIAFEGAGLRAAWEVCFGNDTLLTICLMHLMISQNNPNFNQKHHSDHRHKLQTNNRHVIFEAIREVTVFTFPEPCIVIRICEKDQQDARFC